MLFSFSEEVLVGFGRTVDDGQYYALIVDLVVSPTHQNLGIGKTIFADLRNELKSYTFTTLTSAVGREPFYLKQGWGSQKISFIWPKSEEQRADHVRSGE